MTRNDAMVDQIFDLGKTTLEVFSDGQDVPSAPLFPLKRSKVVRMSSLEVREVKTCQTKQ